jgi:hypothetical protein
MEGIRYFQLLKVHNHCVQPSYAKDPNSKYLVIYLVKDRFILLNVVHRACMCVTVFM